MCIRDSRRARRLLSAVQHATYFHDGRGDVERQVRAQVAIDSIRPEAAQLQWRPLRHGAGRVEEWRLPLVAGMHVRVDELHVRVVGTYISLSLIHI